LSDAQFVERIDEQLIQLNALAAEIVVTVQRDYPQLDASALIKYIQPDAYLHAQHASTHYLFPMTLLPMAA
jgi:CMP-2-keto-3-deoxyoctulosonic acid synthetase